MVNYQLYRTNVFLGGQMQYDLVLDSIGRDLVISDFQISSIDDKLTNLKNDTLLKYDHQTNIKQFYKNNIENFYKYDDFVPNHPLMVDDLNVDTHKDTYEMGCKRMNYKRYGKQFHFFCPLWLEKLDDNQHLVFDILVYSTPEKNVTLASKRLELKPKQIQYHDKCVQYFRDYINYIGIESGNENVLNVDVINYTSTMSGLNVSTGLKEVKTLPNLISNLLYREIPVLEFDNILIQNFQLNNFITSQLFNFNLCFDLEDIMPSFAKQDLIGESVIVDLKVAIVDNDKSRPEEEDYLEKVDLYTNYEYIPKKYCGPYEMDVNGGIGVNKGQDTHNVLSYLQDYQGIPYIDKNKLNPQTIHWSLTGDNEYIFNAYEGFSGWINDGSISHWYGNSPDIFADATSGVHNSTTWCNTVSIPLGTNVNNISLKDLTDLCSTFENGKYTNGLKYEFDIPAGYKNIRLLLIEDKHDLLYSTNIFSKYNTYNISIQDDQNNIKLRVIMISNTIAIISSDQINKFTYKETPDIIVKIFGEDWVTNTTDNNSYDSIMNLYFRTLFNMLSNNNPWKSLSVISSDASLDICKADSPSQSSSEVEYYKSSKRGTYMYRYFGKIRPTFINDNSEMLNYRYYQSKYITGDENKISFFKYKNSQHLPLFPSIGYFSIDKVNEFYDYQKASGDWQNIIDSKIEWKNFNDSSILFLMPSFDVTLESKKDENGNYILIKDLVRQYLKNKYKIEDDKVLNYIYDLYEYDSSYDYRANDDIKNYIYTVKITLK